MQNPTLIRMGEFVGQVADRRTSSMLASAIVMILIGSLDFYSDSAMSDFGINTDLHAAASATFVGVGAGIACFVLLLARRERRKLIRDELIRLSELNHRLRNSLQIIVSAQFREEDERQKEMMLDTAKSMSDALGQLFPAFGFEQRKHARKEFTESIVRD